MAAVIVLVVLVLSAEVAAGYQGFSRDPVLLAIAMLFGAFGADWIMDPSGRKRESRNVTTRMAIGAVLAWGLATMFRLG